MLDPEAAHDGKTCPIDQREILIGIGQSNLPGGFQVRWADRFNCSGAISQSIPKTFRRATVNPRAQKSPCLREDVVRG